MKSSRQAQIQVDSGRPNLRILKQQVREGLVPGASADIVRRARQGALALLDRSIRFGHRRLAVRRLCEAMRLDALVPSECWRYCEKVVAEACDADLVTLLRCAKAHRASHVMAEAECGVEKSGVTL